MVKRFAFTVLLALSLSATSWAAGSQQIDSLKQAAKKAPHDSVQLKILSKIAIAYSDSSYSKSINYWKEALKLANKLKDRQQMGDIHHQIGYSYYKQGEFDSALLEYNNAISVYQFIKNKQEVARVYNDIGLIYKTLGRYEQAVENFMKGLALFDEIDDEEGSAMISNNLGQVHFYQEDYTNAIKYFNKYLITNEKANYARAVAGASNNIAAAYMELKNYDKALGYYNKSLKIYDSLDVAIGVAILSDNIGMLYAGKNNYSESLVHHFKALEIFRLLDSQSRLAHTLNNIGFSYYMLNDYASSNKFLLEAIDLAKKYHQRETEKEIYKNLSSVYEAKNQPNQALRYYKLMTELKDSLINAETTQSIASLELKYKSERHDREYRYLQRKVDQQKNFRLIMFAISTIFLGIIVLLAIDNQRKRNTIEKIMQRKSFLIKTLQHTVEHQKNIPCDPTSSPVEFFPLPLSVTSRNDIEIVHFQNDEISVLVTLWSSFALAPLTVLRAFLSNELHKSSFHNPNKSIKEIVELINSKLLSTISLFDIDKDSIYHTILIVNCKNSKQVCFHASQSLLWACHNNITTRVLPDNSDTFKEESTEKIVLLTITPSSGINTSAFDDFVFKTLQSVSNNNLKSKLDVLSNAFDSWNLAESAHMNQLAIAVRVSCDEEISIKHFSSESKCI